MFVALKNIKVIGDRRNRNDFAQLSEVVSVFAEH